MKKIAIFFLFASCVLLCSCDKRQAAVDDLENFSEELKENSSEYSNQDWEDASAQYEQLVEQVDQYEYTDEELKEIGKLKARCFIVLPNIRQVVEHWLRCRPEHADNPERSPVLAKSFGARCPDGFLDQRAA